MEPTYKVYAKGFRVGPLPLPELKQRLAETPAPAGATVALASPIGDQFGPIEHFPELIPYIQSDSRLPSPKNDEFIGPRSHQPNHIPLGDRFQAVLLLITGSALMYFYVKTGKTIAWASKHGPNIDVSGWWGLPSACFFIGGIVTSVTLIADHYDRRPNEHLYRQALNAGIGLMLIGKLSMILVYHHLTQK